MTLQEAIEPFRDPATRLIRAADGGTDNLPVHSAVYYELLSQADALLSERDLFATYLHVSEVTPGVYRRRPDATDENSVDNLVATLSATQRLNLPEVARRVYDHGVTHRWTYSCLDPRMKFNLWEKDTYAPFFGRFPGIIPFIRICAGVPVSFLSQIALNQSMVWNAELGVDSDVGNRILQWLMNRAVFGRYALVDKGIRAWRELMAKKYKGGMKEVLGLYHGKGHPFEVYGPEDFA